MFKYDGKHFKALENAPAALSTVFSITGNEKGDVFFGTQDGGIVVFSKGKYTSINAKSGICSNLINGIDFKDGDLWIGTDKGVDRIKLTSDLAIDAITYFDNENGFISNEINQNGVFIDEKKNIWFCTNGGITRYNPSLDWAHSIPPKLVLNDIKLSYQHVDWTKFSDSLNPSNNLPVGLSLSYKNNNLSLLFKQLR